MKPDEFILMPIPTSQYAAVCAVLAGAALVAGAGAGNRQIGNAVNTVAAPTPAAAPSAGVAEVSPAAATTDGASAPVGDVEIDAHGHPWNEAMHASTKGKTKDGLWRMKVGVSRPDPLPGYPVDGAGTGTSSETVTNSATAPTATVGELGPAATAGGDDEDEFAAFRQAAEASNAADEAAAASVPARQFSDADLGALCNQAATKLGDPSPIKEIIARYVPEGQVAHSRNIPAERRDEFAKEVEAKAGVQFAG